MASPSSTKGSSPPAGAGAGAGGSHGHQGQGHQGHGHLGRRMSHFKEYKFFRSFSAKVENWPMRKAEQLWRKMRERKIAEIEAAEACKWLRAAGFPQYAQMYEDLQFPIDVSGVQNDHPFLDADSLQSLFRRLTALNRCANMKLEHHHQKHSNDSDDDQCALSDKWQFERKSRRWSRVVDITPQAQRRLQVIAARALAERSAREARGQAEDDDEDDEEPPPTIRVGVVDPDGHYTDIKPDLLAVPGQVPTIQLPDDKDDEDGAETASRFRRTGSERLRDGAKALLRRVESIKTRRRKRQNRTEVIISSPNNLDVTDKYPDLSYIDVSPTTQFPFPDFASSPGHHPIIRTQPPSPMTVLPPSPIAPPEPSFILNPPFGDDSSSYYSDNSMGSSHKSSTKSKLGNRAKRFLHRGVKNEDTSALSDSECQPASWRHHYFKDSNSNNNEICVEVEPPSPVELKPDPNVLEDVQKSPGHTTQRRCAIRTSSLNLGKDSNKFRDKSYLKRDKSASRSSELDGSPNSASSRSHDGDDDDDSIDINTKQKNNVQRWCSFRTSSLNGGPKASANLQTGPQQKDPESYLSRPMSSLSCGQLHVLRKLALLRLTACMERYCPSHKSGWNWELPKIIRKIKTPDYKDKTVFGVPLTVSLQRSGHSLPKPIQSALVWLKNNALEQMGIFRKAGVKSRIAKLRTLTETTGSSSISFSNENMSETGSQSSLNFDGAQAHDVADLVKQYFRELPDALLTNKLSETFIAIFQHVPEPLRCDAVQCALLLLPEEHLESLHSLLIFLGQVAEHSAVNQMTASNLAVCLAPTLLRLHHAPPQAGSTKEGNSTRTLNESIADQRQISESRAAHACLLLLIQKHKQLFMAPADMLARCKFNYFEESVPVALDELGADFQQDWKGFQQACIKALLKEAREKVSGKAKRSRGWVSVSGAAPHVDLCCKKVGDGHPLRLWRVSTDVEAPPQEVMQRILRERHMWDDSLVKWRVVETLGPNAEVFQYITSSTTNLPSRDFCVLRSWQQGGGSGSGGGGGWCAIAETSVAHNDAAAPPAGGARGVVLASRYLAQPAGKGRSRLLHLARVDTMGRTPEWYNKCYGHISALYLARLRASFKHNTDGPESNV